MSTHSRRSPGCTGASRLWRGRGRGEGTRWVRQPASLWQGGCTREQHDERQTPHGAAWLPQEAPMPARHMLPTPPPGGHLICATVAMRCSACCSCGELLSMGSNRCPYLACSPGCSEWRRAVGVGCIAGARGQLEACQGQIWVRQICAGACRPTSKQTWVALQLSCHRCGVPESVAGLIFSPAGSMQCGAVQCNGVGRRIGNRHTPAGTPAAPLRPPP